MRRNRHSFRIGVPCELEARQLLSAVPAEVAVHHFRSAHAANVARHAPRHAARAQAAASEPGQLAGESNHENVVKLYFYDGAGNPISTAGISVQFHEHSISPSQNPDNNQPEVTGQDQNELVLSWDVGRKKSPLVGNFYTGYLLEPLAVDRHLPKPVSFALGNSDLPQSQNVFFPENLNFAFTLDINNIPTSNGSTINLKRIALAQGSATPFLMTPLNQTGYASSSVYQAFSDELTGLLKRYSKFGDKRAHLTNAGNLWFIGQQTNPRGPTFIVTSNGPTGIVLQGRSNGQLVPIVVTENNDHNCNVYVLSPNSSSTQTSPSGQEADRSIPTTRPWRPRTPRPPRFAGYQGPRGT